MVRFGALLYHFSNLLLIFEYFSRFMVRLNEQLKYFVSMKISTDSLWQNVKVILSGHETPGEGEHKIMDFIRYEKSKPDYNPNIRHCLYGLDADLVMLGLCTRKFHAYVCILNLQKINFFFLLHLY